MHVGDVHNNRRSPTGELARIVLTSFLLTFLIARILVILIMLRWLPDLYLHLGGTHVHHLNYGIFLLSGVGAYLLMERPEGRRLRVSAAVYGVGLALTFDEFGMWLHLGGSYWQRASFDAVVVIVSVLLLIVVGPVLNRFRPRHWAATAVLAVLTLSFTYLLVRSVHLVGHRVLPHLERIEAHGPR